MADPAAENQGLVDRLRGRATTGQVRIVHILLGHRAANRFFWVAPRQGAPSWTDVRHRVDWLARRSEAAAADFVRVSLDRTTNPSVVVGLARHAASSDVARQALEELVADSEVLWPRVEDNAALAGAFAGAARILLDASGVRSFVGWVTGRYPTIPANFIQAMDTVGYRFADADDLEARMRTAADVRSRLIIAEDTTDLDTVVAGAKRVTVLATSDTYGRSEVIKRRGAGDVTVEHVRSRVSRFSRPYISLHLATKELAQRLAAGLASLPNVVDPVHRSAVEVSLADFLFFSAIRARAVREVLDDPAFDSVLVVLDGQPETSAYIRQLAAVPDLTTDPRVELVSVSRRSSSFRRFWTLAEAIAAGPRVEGSIPLVRPPRDLIEDKLAARCAHLAGSLPTFGEKGERGTVLLMTAESPAYNASTVAYTRDLAETYALRVVQYGSDAGPLADAFAGLARQGQAPPFGLMPTSRDDIGTLPLLLAEVLGEVLRQAEPGPDAPTWERTVWGVAATDLERLTRALGGHLVQFQTIDHWFRRMTAENALPDVVVATPQRNPGVNAVLAAARKHGTPSVVVEPHMQDANYCRYTKVAGDYYGVVSDYFADRTAGAFGIGPDRIRAIGTPRHVAPVTHDREASRRTARASLGASHDLDLGDGQLLMGFFSQPAAWDGISSVWTAVLQAARATGTKVLLKPHPEDAPARIRQYMALADRGEVLLMKGDLAVALDACDFVVTTFSAVAIDALLRRVPAVAIADGDAAYPVDLPAMLSIPLVRSAEELVKLIAAFGNDPAAFSATAERFLRQEPQFEEGPGPRLRTLVDEAIRRGGSGVRPVAEVPEHLFLDEPHPTFPV